MPRVTETFSARNSSAMNSTVELSYFDYCRLQNIGDDTKTFRCVSGMLQDEQAHLKAVTTSWLLVIAGALVFFMQVGFAMLCAGCVRRKNVQNTMLKNLLDACGAAVAYYCIGYAFSFGDNEVEGQKLTFIGLDNFFLMGDVDPAFFFFEYAFSATSVTIVAGTLAERCQMAAYLCYSLFLTGIVYPVVAHAIWSNHGFLSAFAVDPILGRGVIDFAGSGVVHITGGTTALIATYILGARRGRFTDSRGRPLPKPKSFPGHSIALQLLGTMVLWFGWYGFNPGSALLLTTPSAGHVGAVAAVNTSLAAAMGAISALLLNLYIQERKTGEYSFDLTQAMNGLLSGLVAVTAPCGTIDYWAAIVVGLVAGPVYLFGSKLLIRLRLDDAVDAIPVHMFNGIWGLLAVGLFSTAPLTEAAFGSDEYIGWFFEIGRGSFNAILLANQVIAICCIIGWVTGTMLPFFVMLNYMGWFRADSLEELVGLDMSYHGGHVGGEDDDFNDKHVQAYKKKKRKRGELRRRRKSSTDASVEDPDQFDDAISWTDMTTASEQAPRRRLTQRSTYLTEESECSVDSAGTRTVTSQA